MSDDKSKASDIAKNIWLAGVGAYGRAVEEAQGRLEKAMEPPKLFRDLVKVGAALEEDAREGTVAARQSVEERISKVRENFHNQRPARYEELADLHKKVDKLTRKIDQLSKALAEQGLGVTTRQKASPAKKKAAKKSPPTGRKPAKKKVAAKKTVSKKAAVKKKAGGSRTAAGKR